MYRWAMGTAILLAGLTAGRSPRRSVDADLAIVNVNVVDATSPVLRPNLTVAVKDGRIVAVGPSRTIELGRSTRKVDGTGKYLIPGLWDMHGHLGGLAPTDVALLPLFGVTAVRDMGGDVSRIQELLTEARRSGYPVPRARFAGPIIESRSWYRRVVKLLGDSIFAHSRRIGVETADNAAGAVDSVLALGGEFVKMRTAPNPATYLAVAAEARRRGIRFASHYPNHQLTLSELARAGLGSLEHCEGFYATLLDSLPEEQRRAELAAVVGAGLWLDPTLSANNVRFLPDSLAIPRMVDTLGAIEPRLRYVSRRVWTAWGRVFDQRKYGPKPEEWKRILAADDRQLRALHGAGVRFLAGTDFTVTFMMPGPTLLEEVGLLVNQVGLTPHEAIGAATFEPARFFGIEDSTGTIAIGKRADLVLLDANPLASIGNLKRIRGVGLGGQWIDSEERDRLLSRIAAEVRKP